MNLDDIKSLMDSFDPASLLPEVESLLTLVADVLRIAVMAGPVLLLVLGLAYLFLAPREANYHFGYRCFFGMGSVEAWRYTQRIAGMIWTLLGLGLTVVAGIVSGGFPEKEIHDVLSSALTCILWQAGLVALSCIVINTLAAVNFDAQGELRRRKPVRK